MGWGWGGTRLVLFPFFLAIEDVIILSIVYFCAEVF